MPRANGAQAAEAHAQPAAAPDRTRQFSKTKLCKFEQMGICAKGTSCPFAHNDTELRELPDLRCTKLCFSMLQSGSCTKRECTFAHSREELRSTGALHKTKLCRFAQTGCCALGPKCGFAHSQGEIRTTGMPSKRRTPSGPTKAAPPKPSALAPPPGLAWEEEPDEGSDGGSSTTAGTSSWEEPSSVGAVAPPLAAPFFGGCGGSLGLGMGGPACGWGNCAAAGAMGLEGFGPYGLMPGMTALDWFSDNGSYAMPLPWLPGSNSSSLTAEKRFDEPAYVPLMPATIPVNGFADYLGREAFGARWSAAAAVSPRTPPAVERSEDAY